MASRSAIFSDLSEYYNNPTFSDVRLYTKARTIHANSLVLAAQSPVFKELIAEERDIFLDAFLDEEEEMEMVVGSLYNRAALHITQEVLFTVAKFGITYKVQWLEEEALKFVKENISHNNCVDMSRCGHRLKENFKYPAIWKECAGFLTSTKYLEEIVVQLEMLLDEDLFFSLPADLFSQLLQNKLRRDERRVVELLRRWFQRDSNAIQAMGLLPHLQLSQLYLVNKELHTQLFEFLVASDKLTAEDRRTILHLSADSIADSTRCIVTGIGFSKEVTKDTGAQHIKDLLSSTTWTSCSFDDIVMVKQYTGVNEFLYLELFLAWSRNNRVSEHQAKVILGAIDLGKVSREYLTDMLAHLRASANYTDSFSKDLEARIAVHDYATNPMREFMRQTLTAGNMKTLKLKKHTLTARPCSVSGCKERTLGFVDVKLKRDGLPLYKLGKMNFAPTMLEHCHNRDVLHVYFLVGKTRVVSCYTDSWRQLEETLQPDLAEVVIKVVCMRA